MLLRPAQGTRDGNVLLRDPQVGAELGLGIGAAAVVTFPSCEAAEGRGRMGAAVQRGWQ